MVGGFILSRAMGLWKVMGHHLHSWEPLAPKNSTIHFSWDDQPRPPWPNQLSTNYVVHKFIDNLDGAYVTFGDIGGKVPSSIPSVLDLRQKIRHMDIHES